LHPTIKHHRPLHPTIKHHRPLHPTIKNNCVEAFSDLGFKPS